MKPDTPEVAESRARFHAHMEQRYPGIDMSIRIDGLYWENRDDDWELWQVARADLHHEFRCRTRNLVQKQRSW